MGVRFGGAMSKLRKITMEEFLDSLIKLDSSFNGSTQTPSRMIKVILTALEFYEDGFRGNDIKSLGENNE